MHKLEYDRIYDLSVLTYSNMQLHPAEEAAGAQAKVEVHHFSDEMPPMGEGGKGPEPGWPIHHDNPT